ncbi:MAG: TonB-dependent receptor plug domain-containing protein, partial [Williamsia sp.]|nr:TonB-dependent receptor plug domain-containing protein [Williamsia sp.]
MNISTNRWLLILFAALCYVQVQAQEKKTVSGTIKTPGGSPVSSASIHEVGTSNATLSDSLGNYRISVKPTATLEFSSVGYSTFTLSVATAGDFNVVLQPAENSLNEVVVTALGIQRQKKSLGYAIQEVKGQTLVESREVNLVNDLTGKVAGLQVVRSGNGPAGSSQILLRGNNSLTGLSQPLIVIDGIPVDNTTGRVGLGASNGFYNTTLDQGNTLSDINPEDIASISVLKGPTAAALYGSLGGNGVILITTKTGKKQSGLGISVSSSVGFESIFTSP